MMMAFHRLSLFVARRLPKTPVATRVLSNSTTTAASSTTTTSFGLTPADVQMKRSHPMDESTWSASKRKILLDESTRNDLAYSLAFASASSYSKANADADSDAASVGYTFNNNNNSSSFAPSTDERMKQQLRYSKNQLRRTSSSSSSSSLDPKQNANNDSLLFSISPPLDHRPLPRTLQDACRPTRRAVVITEATAPFRVFDVNHAWEELCGYTFVESVGKTLGSLLAGPETDSVAATALITQLMRGEQEAGTTLTNYTKNGRRFRNRIRVGPLEDESRHVTHFVGVLQEVRD